MYNWGSVYIQDFSSFKTAQTSKDIGRICFVCQQSEGIYWEYMTKFVINSNLWEQIFLP